MFDPSSIAAIDTALSILAVVFPVRVLVPEKVIALVSPLFPKVIEPCKFKFSSIVKSLASDV